MKSLKQDTLAFQLGTTPGTQLVNNGGFSIPPIVSNLSKFMQDSSVGACFGADITSEGPLGNPEVDALLFYMLNHAVSIVRQRVHPLEPLGPYMPVLKLFNQHLAIRSARMFFYLLLICTRESRHVKNFSESSLQTTLRSKYGENVCNFHSSIVGSGSSGAVEKFKSNPPSATLGDYTNFLTDLFYKGHFSSSYGGPAWGAVATVLRDFSVGSITAEMMMDTAFTLCHNNGPIFNKGMLFSSYSKEIYKILDVQRSGQIPQLVGNKETKHHSNPLVSDVWSSCRSVLGDEFEGYVDWFKVEELGALNSYPTNKAAQVAAHGHPVGSKAHGLAASAKAAVAQAVADKWVDIMPGVKVKLAEVTR